jgi:endoglucanase
VVGHIDEIGLVVTHIDEKGFLWFAPIGGWDPQILVGQRVEVRGRDGLVPGVVGRKPIHLLDGDQRKKVVELKGFTSTSAQPTATRHPRWSASATR